MIYKYLFVQNAGLKAVTIERHRSEPQMFAHLARLSPKAVPLRPLRSQLIALSSSRINRLPQASKKENHPIQIYTYIGYML